MNRYAIYAGNNKIYKQQKLSLLKIFGYIYSLGIFLKFGLSSLTASFIDVGMFSIFMLFFSKSDAFHIFIYTFIARIFSGIFNYYANRVFVFSTKEKNKSSAVKFCLVFFLKVVLSSFFVGLITNLKIIPTIYAKIIVDTSLFLVNYICQKNLVFIKSDQIS